MCMLSWKLLFPVLCFIPCTSKQNFTGITGCTLGHTFAFLEEFGSLFCWGWSVLWQSTWECPVRVCLSMQSIKWAWFENQWKPLHYWGEVDQRLLCSLERSSWELRVCLKCPIHVVWSALLSNAGQSFPMPGMAEFSYSTSLEFAHVPYPLGERWSVVLEKAIS